MNLIKFFESIFKEAEEQEDTFVFDFVDIDAINPTIPEGVTNVELSYTPFMYRLKYDFNGKNHIKYFACTHNDLRDAIDIASQDGEITDNDPSSHVSLVASTRDINNAKPLPMGYKYRIIDTMKRMFPDGHCDIKSEHIAKNAEAKKAGHGIVPDKILDSWSKRAINCAPSEIEYLYERIGSDVLIIPVKVAYIGFCKELAKVCTEVRNNLKGFMNRNNRGFFTFKPAIVRVYSLKDPCILTEYMFSLSPKYEQEHKDILIHTNDTDAPNYSIKDFTKSQIDDISALLKGTIEYSTRH